MSATDVIIYNTWAFPCFISLTVTVYSIVILHKLFSTDEDPSIDAINAIRQASFNLRKEDPDSRFIAEEACTRQGMEAKMVREGISQLYFNDRKETDGELESSRQARSTAMERVAKWIVRNDIEKTEIEHF